MKTRKLFFYAFFFISLLIISPAVLSTPQVAVVNSSGGNISANMGFDSDWMYGSRGDGLRQGGAVSTLDYNPSFTSYNPAVLAFLNNGQASLDLGLPILSSGLVGLFMNGGVDGTVKKAINTPLTDNSGNPTMSMFGLTMNNGFSPNFNSVIINASEGTGFTGYEIMVPFAKGQAGFGYAREDKQSLDLTLMLTGLQTELNVTDPSNPSLNIDVKAEINAILNLQADNIVTSFGIGRKLTPEWGVGAVLDHYDSRFLLNASGGATGTATYNATTTPLGGDPDHSLDQSATANLTSDAWGLRFGTSYHFNKDTLELGADFSVAPELKFSGPASAISHIIPQTIDLADFTKTIETSDPNVNGTVLIKMPSYGRLTFAWKSGFVGTINVTQYFDDMYFIAYNPTGRDELHLNMMQDVRIAFNFGGFQFGGGGIYTRVWEKDTTGVSKNLAWLFLPVFSTGTVIPFGDYLKWEVELLASSFPDVQDCYHIFVPLIGGFNEKNITHVVINGGICRGMRGGAGHRDIVRQYSAQSFFTQQGAGVDTIYMRVPEFIERKGHIKNIQYGRKIRQDGRRRGIKARGGA